MNVDSSVARRGLAARAGMVAVNGSLKIVRHTVRVRHHLRRVIRAVLRGQKAVRHAVMRRKLAWKGFRYRSRWTAWGGTAWKAAALVRAPRETRLRQRLAKEYTARLVCAEMPRHRGYSLLPPNHFADMPAVISTCRGLFERKMAESDGAPAQATGIEQGGQLKVRAEKREHLRNLLGNDDLRQHPILVDFALSDAVMGVAARYLGTVPYLNRVDLLYSVARPGEEKVASQLFHVDPEGLTQVKYFINIFDVDDAQGPFTFIPADETARVIREVGERRLRQGKPHAGRYLDDEIEAVHATDAIVRVKGSQGSAVAVDTSRCLHLGSRVQPGAFRLCLYLQYCTTRERGNVFDVERYRHDPVRHLAIRHSLASRGNQVSAPHQMGMQ